MTGWKEDTIFRHHDEEGWRKQQEYRRKLWRSRLSLEREQRIEAAEAKAGMLRARAEEICSAICYRSFFAMGLAEEEQLESLDGVSLRQMFDAVWLVEVLNKERAAEAKGTGYTLLVVPDERLIAAVFALENYGPTYAPIARNGASFIKVLAGSGRYS